MHDISWVFAIFSLGDLNFFGWRNSEIETFLGFSLINVGDSPPFDETVSSGSDVVVFILEKHFDHTFMERNFVFSFEHEMGLNELTFPNNESSILSSTDNLSIWKLIERSLIGELELSELGNLSLELETGESLGHLPEPDMA